MENVLTANHICYWNTQEDEPGADYAIFLIKVFIFIYNLIVNY